MAVASAGEAGMNVKEIAARIGVPVSTAYHLVNTLTDERMLAKDDGRRYHLGSTVSVLARCYYQQAQQPIQIVARLHALAAETGETAYFSAWRHNEIVILESAEGSQAVRVSELQPGFAGVAHARASGKVLLAFTDERSRNEYMSQHPLERVTPSTITSLRTFKRELKQVLEQGYATDDEEFTTGVSCVAAPVFEHQGLLGAFTLSIPAERFRARRDYFIDIVKRAVELDNALSTSLRMATPQSPETARESTAADEHQ
jgi:IclR family transcriptional regulator, acetate operon repressor